MAPLQFITSDIESTGQISNRLLEDQGAAFAHCVLMINNIYIYSATIPKDYSTGLLAVS